MKDSYRLEKLARRRWLGVFITLSSVALLAPVRVQALGEEGYLLVTDYDQNKVLRYDAATGEFVDEFVTRGSGTLNQSWYLVFGPHDGNLYVGSGHFRGPGYGQGKGVLRFDGVTGEFIDKFVDPGPPSENEAKDAVDPSGRIGLLSSVHGVIFGPDGNLYVGDWSGAELSDDRSLGVDIIGSGRILRFDGVTGEFIDEFVPFQSGGLHHPFGMLFWPDGDGHVDLYVADLPTGSVLRYDGLTGEPLGEFVASGSGGLILPISITFGPDGNLYVSHALGEEVLRYQGPSGPSPGAFMNEFVSPGSGGLLDISTGLLFGPDGNGDGYQDLYISSGKFAGGDTAIRGNIKRYDGLTGEFIDDFVPIGSGGLDNAAGITFTWTDPMTLEYLGE